MNARTQLLVVLVSAFAAFAPARLSALQSTSGSYTLWGTVFLPEGSSRPLKGIEVRLELAGHVYLNSTTTDEEGRFQFRNLGSTSCVYMSCDSLHLYVNLDGFEPLDQTVEIPAPKPNAPVLEPHVVLVLRRGLMDDTERHTGSGLDDRKAAVNKPLIADAGLLKKYPAKAVTEYNDGVKEAQQGNPDKAIGHFNKAVAASPDFIEAFTELGLAYQRKGQVPEAEAALQHAQGIDPKSAVVMTKLGGVLLDKARAAEQKGQADAASKAYNDAADTLDAATRLDLTSSEAHYLLGSALFKTDELSDAELNLLLAINAAKPLQDARLMLVNVYMKQRRYREALDQLTAYLTAVPDSPQRKAIEETQSRIRSAINPRSDKMSATF